MGCNEWLTKEDDKMIEASMRGENTGLESVPKEILERVMPEIERASQERDIECLRENIENAKNEINERLEEEKREPTDLEKLDLLVAPNTEELQHRIGKELSKELGFSEHAIVNFPTIYGTKGVKNASELIEKTMRTLYDFKMERGLWDVSTVSGIMFIDAETSEDFNLAPKTDPVLGYVHPSEVLIESQKSPATVDIHLDKKTAKEIGLTRVPEPGEFKAKEILPRILHIVLDKSGKFLAEKLEQKLGLGVTLEKPIPYGKVLTWVLSHEVHHLGYYKQAVEGYLNEVGNGPNEKRITDHKDEWEKAKTSQNQKGPVAKYGFGPTDPEEEFNAQCIAAWEAGSPRLCSEMKEFFDKYFS